MVPFIVFIATYATFYLSSYPSVPGGDSGELIAEACQLGIPHPPGYPLLTLLFHLVAWMPQIRIYNFSCCIDWSPTSAFKMAHLCCILSALSATFMYLTITTVLKARNQAVNFNNQGITMLASVVVFSFAFSPLFWEYAITAEVFALNNFFVSLLLWITVKIVVNIVQHSNDSRRLICMGGFISGLSFTNQHTSLLHIIYLIAVIIVVLFRYKRSKVVFTVFIAGICFLAGLSPYIYLFYTAQYHPVGSWGDTSNLTGLLRHMLRSEYGTFRLGMVEGSETAMQRIWIYLQFTNQEMHYAPLVITACYFVFSRLEVWAAAREAKIRSAALPQQQSSQKQQRRKNKPASNNDSPSMTAENESKTTHISSTNHIYWLLLIIISGNWVFYILTWHGIFSNLPLSSPMPFAVHARFWLQPNISLTVWLGCIFVEMMSSLPGIHSLPLMGVHPVIITIVAVLITAHWSTMYRNDYDGWTMHRYAENIIQSPQRLAKEMNVSDIILLAHTDLDWNPVRYLLTCEQHIPLEIPTHHLSLQMMPYPWFATTQHEHFPTIEFPNTQFIGVSTDRHAEGNARLITEFLSANLRSSKQKKAKDKDKVSLSMKQLIFLDMQAVNEGEIGSMGSWRGFTLIPFGLQYLVLPSPPSDNTTYSVIETYYHQQSWQAIQRVHLTMPVVNETYMKKYPLGSWESAAMSVYHDAHYQLGLFYLTYAMEKPDINMDTLPLVIDRLLAAEQLLSKAWTAASTFKTFSGAVSDLQKNTALAYMRLQAMLLVTAQVMPKYQPALEEAIVRRDRRMFLLPDLLKRMTLKSEMKKMLIKAKENMKQFVQDNQQDRDVSIFMGAINKLEAKLAEMGEALLQNR